MEIKLQKRKDVKAKFRPEISESVAEADLYYEILQSGYRAQKQYPIKNYFVDIAYPEIKLAIEYDGEEFHKDKEKDAMRDAEIKAEGWEMFRINKHSFDSYKEWLPKMIKNRMEEYEISKCGDLREKEGNLKLVNWSEKISQMKSKVFGTMSK